MAHTMAELQESLDMLGAAEWWLARISRMPCTRDGFLLPAAQEARNLWCQRALERGAVGEQIADCRDYSLHLLAKDTMRPTRAGHSFSDFLNRAGIQADSDCLEQARRVG